MATGSRPLVPSLPGLGDIEALTNETVFSLTDAPSSLGILGAGPVGCELAQAFARLGVRVTLFETEAAVLPNEEPEASRGRGSRPDVGPGSTSASASP